MKEETSVLKEVVLKGSPDKVNIFDQTPINTYLLGRKYNKCKCPEAGARLEALSYNMEAHCFWNEVSKLE